MVCLLLLGASLPVFARDAITDTVADTPCTPAASPHQIAPALDAGAARRAPAGSASKTRPAVSGGGETDGPTRGPRWHSFLPGMFR